MIAARTAAARLRRMRWALTLLYAAVSAVSLVTLVVIAASIDARSGSRDLDSEIKGRVQALSRAVWMDQGALHLEPLSEDELATASDVTAVLQRIGAGDAQTQWLRPERDGVLPGVSRLDDLWATTVREQEPVLATIVGSGGRKLRWATAPVWDADEIGAVVLIAVDLAPEERSHTELVLWLAADRVTGGRGGIGVGLAIVRWVAELHGGRAYVAPTSGRGALVELALPCFIVR
jgi:hypothetical protein